MPYVKVPISFAVTEWPTSPGSQNFYFNPRNAKQNIGRLLMFVAEHLYKARQPFTSRVPFTIINAYSPLSRVSLGFDESPSDIFYSNNTPLTFTFALSRDKDASTTEPNSIRKPNRNMFIWGDSVRDRTKFLTLKLDPDVTSNLKLEQMLISNMRYIYFVVGAFTKNLVRNSGWYGSNPSFIEDGHSGIDTMVSNITIPDLFKHFDYTFWAYNKSVWKNASNLLVEEHWNDNLKLYYAAYLYDIEPQFGEIAAVFKDTMTKFLVQGLFNVVGAINGSVLTKPGIAALLYIYRAFNKTTPSYIDERQWAYDYMNKISLVVNRDPELKHKFIQAMSDKPGIARSFLTFSAKGSGIIDRFKGVDHGFR